MLHVDSIMKSDGQICERPSSRCDQQCLASTINRYTELRDINILLTIDWKYPGDLDSILLKKTRFYSSQGPGGCLRYRAQHHDWAIENVLPELMSAANWDVRTGTAPFFGTTHARSAKLVITERYLGPRIKALGLHIKKKTWSTTRLCARGWFGVWNFGIGRLYHSLVNVVQHFGSSEDSRVKMRFRSNIWLGSCGFRYNNEKL